MIYDIIEVVLAVIISSLFQFALIDTKKYLKNYIVVFSIFIIILSAINVCVRVWLIDNDSFLYSYDSIVFIYIPQLVFSFIIRNKTKVRIMASFVSISNAYLSFYFLFMMKSAFARFIHHPFAFMLVIYLTLSPLMFIFLKYVYKRLQDIIDEHLPRHMFMLLLYFIAMIGEVAVYTSLANSTELKLLRIEVFSVAILSVYYISIFGLYILLNSYMRKSIELTNLMASKHEMDVILEHTKENKENEEKQRILRHDMRHVLNNVAGLINEGNTEEALNVINHYNSSITEATTTKYCEDTIINSVIGFYATKCKKENIKFDVRVNDFESNLTCPMEEVGLILSNILENAYNATKWTKNPFIRLKFLNNRGRVILQVSNSYEGKIKFSSNNTPISLKKDHGIGSTSIKYYAKKNNLLVDYNVKDDTFKITVLF